MRTSRVDLSPLTRQRPFASVAAMDPGQRAEVSAEALARVHAAAPMDPCTFGCSVALRTTGAAIGQAGFQAPPSDGVIEIACGVDTCISDMDGEIANCVGKSKDLGFYAA